MITGLSLQQRRQLSYYLASIGFGVVLLLGHTSGWVGSAELHTIMEVIATLLAVIVGLMALVRYYVKKESLFCSWVQGSMARPSWTVITQ